MGITNISSITKTYHSFQNRRIELNRKRIEGLPATIAPGYIIPEPRDLPIGRGRRVEASILFLDISGFTSRPSETPQEQDAQVRILSLFFSEMIRVISDYGGTVEKNTGDGVMAYFGRSAGPGDVKQRSVACAMTMFHAADQFINPIIERSGLMPLRFRICIDHGTITVARLGAARRFNHIVAVGAAANRTSKMLGHAEAGELLLGDEILSGLPNEWLEYVTLKDTNTGWYYPNGAQYNFWGFSGRWNFGG